MQTTVLKVSVTFDPKALVAWAKRQKGACCYAPAHDSDHLDWLPPELEAQSILAHAFLTSVEDAIDGGSVETLETGIPPELAERIDDDYQAALNNAKRQEEDDS